LQHYTIKLLSNWLRNDVLASRLQTSCLPNTPQLMSVLFIVLGQVAH